jgi:hypothetical protein
MLDIMHRNARTPAEVPDPDVPKKDRNAPDASDGDNDNVAVDSARVGRIEGLN